LIVNAVPAAQACVTVIVHGPDPLMDGVVPWEVHVPAVVVVLVIVGWVHPAGTTNVTYELAGKVSSVGAVKVKPS
jgi:hypothetical protein